MNRYDLSDPTGLDAVIDDEYDAWDRLDGQDRARERGDMAYTERIRPAVTSTATDRFAVIALMVGMAASVALIVIAAVLLVQVTP